MNYIFLFLLNIPLWNVQVNFDSLLKANSTLPETTQIKILIDNCWLYRNSNPKFAIQCGDEAIKKAKRIENKKLHSEALNLLGVVYRNLGEHEKALYLYNDALNLAIESKDSIQIAFSYNNIGGIYRLQGNNPLALEYVLKALNIFEKFNHKKGIAFCSINIGLIYKNQGENDSALEYLMNTLEIRKEINDEPGIALTLNLIAEVYTAKKDLKNAMNYYLLAESKYKKLKDKRGIASAWTGIGNIFKLKNDYNKALYYHSQALNLSEKLDYNEGKLNNLNKLAIIYAELNRLEEAKEFLNRAKETIKNLKAAYIILESYKQWIRFSEIIKDYENAFYYSQKYNAMQDSLFNQRNISIVATMESIYKAEKSERENAILQKDIELAERQRDYFIVITLLILLISVITYSRYITKKIANEKLKNLNSMKDTLLRIIAHDLRIPFNVLFGYLSLLKDNYETLSDEEKLSYLNNMEKAAKQNFHLLENLLLWSRAQTGRLEIDIKELCLYEIVLENFSIFNSVAKTKNILLETNVPEDIIVKADENMLNTILRNLIQNGIKFTNEGGKVLINAERENKYVKITVEDDGIGMDDETINKLFELDINKSRNGTAGESGTGLGLILCRDFIEKLNGKLFVESQINKGSKFIFTLPSANNV
ncbi:MAG: tetratricopeptide repeat-containing sensor histidine kinase [Melioribacter sp.]|uniref:tetratricopeptide repeat-containing sensor histidine kinase n=1 Tax=Rosettibacter primus TaxID=3111523 RepID=UPI00247B3D8F|nr:tetratricopeptide repeat-containing sensor histidine kinase [Melioribacter sp.]